jgi:hypothetical protein
MANVPKLMDVAAGQPARFTRTVIASAAGHVYGDLVPLAYDRVRGTARYDLRVVNHSDSAVECFAYVMCPHRGRRPVSQGALAVAPQSLVSFPLEYRITDTSSPEPLIAELRSEHVSLIVEAPPPGSPPGEARRGAVAASVSIAAVSGIAALWLFLAPQIGDFSVPSSAVAGSAVVASYRTHGVGNVSYAYRSKASPAPYVMTVPGGSGSFSIPIGQSAPDLYNVELLIDGPLGRVRQDAEITVRPLPEPQVVVRTNEAPRITSLSVASTAVAPGMPVEVHYAARAEKGELLLLDDQGGVWDHTAFSNGGVSQLRAPSLPGERPFRVVLRVSGRGGKAESSVGVIVSPQAIAFAPNSVPAGPEAPAAAPSGLPGLAENTVFRAPARVRGGEAFEVMILSYRSHLRLALIDGKGHTVRAADIRSGERGHTLTAPAVKGPTPYSLIATYGDGIGQETLVQSIEADP